MTNAAYTTLIVGTSALKATAKPHLVVIEGGADRTFAHKAQLAPDPFFTPLRLIACVVCSFLIALAIYLPGYVAHVTAEAALDAAQTEVMRVASGDSLWSIAEEHPVEGTTVKDVVEWLREENSLTSSNLQIGQELLVPIAS